MGFMCPLVHVFLYLGSGLLGISSHSRLHSAHLGDLAKRASHSAVVCDPPFSLIRAFLFLERSFLQSIHAFQLLKRTPPHLVQILIESSSHPCISSVIFSNDMAFCFPHLGDITNSINPPNGGGSIKGHRSDFCCKYV